MTFFLRPIPIANSLLSDDILEQDYRSCKHYGSCGIGSCAIYMGGFFFDCRRYLPIEMLKRVYKRVAMSRGGFTGKGIFGAIPYFVIEWGDGKTEACRFKQEEDIDALIAEIKIRHPQIPTMSKVAQKRIEDEKKAEEAKYVKNLSDVAKKTVQLLQDAKDFLDKRPDLSSRLSFATKALRMHMATRPAVRWSAFAILVMGFIAAIYGIWVWIFHDGYDGLYITLGGLSVIFIFSGVSVIPTAKNNRVALEKNLIKTREDMKDFIESYPLRGKTGIPFPIPVKYTHPATLSRMIRAIRCGFAETPNEALAYVGKELSMMNSSMRVSKAQYDEIVAIQAMFLLEE